MTGKFVICDLPVAGGTAGLCALPGRYSPYAHDLAAVLDWHPDLVLSMITLPEMAGKGAARLGDDLGEHDIAWRHLPIADFGAPGAGVIAVWPEISTLAQGVLATGGRVLVHCYGGCGRSGMALLRLMVEAGEPGPQALSRLRNVRACAVETQAQLDWAFAAGPN